MNDKGDMMVKYSVKNFKGTLKKLINSMKLYLPLIILALVFAIVGSVLTIVGPNQLSKITDAITDGIFIGIDLEYIKKISLILLIIYVFSSIFSFLEGFIMTNVTQKYTKDLREKIALKVNILPLKYFDNHETGDVLSRVTNDVDIINQTMNQSIGSLVSAITLLIGCLIMMFTTNVLMSVTAIISSLIGFGIMIIILLNSQKYFNIQQEMLGTLNGYIEETYSSLNVVKASNGASKSKNKFNKYNKELFTSARKSQFLSGLMPPIMSFIGNFGYVAVCVVGAYLVINGDITFGVIIAFIIYVRLFSSPLTSIAQAANSLQSTTAAAERVFDFLDEEELSKENVTKSLPYNDAKGNIVFEHVKFSYQKDKPIIKDFNANIKSGSKIAIVGPTGAGKTTLVNLLMKFYEIDSGKITIDGIDIKDLGRDNIHDLFCMVLQDTWIFEDTIKSNIRFNQDKISDEEIIKASKIVGLDHLIKTLPNGYNTLLSDSETLSAGEKQLLTIARGMLKKAPFLILDEATSSVDTRTEELVQKAMDKLTIGKTSFIIAHRLSTIKNADLILVMNEGNIIEQGNHEELMKLKGFYAKLYNSQFQQ